MREQQKKNRYTDAFRNGAVQMVFDSGRTLTQVAVDLGVNHWTLRDWYRLEVARRRSKGVCVVKKLKKTARGAKKRLVAEESVSPPGESSADQIARLSRENRRLRRRVNQLHEDGVILKKAAAFSASQSE